MKNVSAGLVVALLLALVVGVGLIQAFANFTGGIELRPAAPALQTSATMSVSAPYSPNSTSNTFKVDVNIANVNNQYGLGAFEFELLFDGGILEGQSGTHDTWLSNQGKRDIVELPANEPWIVAEPGLVAMGAATCPVPNCGDGLEQQKTETGPTGDGRLATVTFHVKGSGVTNLTFDVQKTQTTDTQAQVLQTATTGATIGAFQTTLVPGDASSNKYNAIALPVAGTSITNADQLWDYIEAQIGTGTVKKVLWWDPDMKIFLARRLSPFGTRTGDNFLTPVGGYYFVQLGASVNINLLFAGLVPDPAVSFEIDKGTASSCAYNYLSMPLNRNDITTADQFRQQFPGATKIMEWDAASGTFTTWRKTAFGTWTGDDFPVKIGKPYVVCVDQNGPATWP